MLATVALSVVAVLIATGMTIVARRSNWFHDIDWRTFASPDGEAASPADGMEAGS
jgi:hypothetical protein